jgi:anti-anti-sigma factor
MTVDRPLRPILVIRGEGQLGWDIEVSLLDTDGNLRPLERRAIPHAGDDLGSIVAQIAAAGTSFQDVIVDLERVGWLNSTGLGWLVGLVRQRKARQERVALAGVNERIAQLLKVTSLDLVLQRYPTVAEAAAALRAGSGGKDG